ncbi:MAG: NAD-binding protein [Haloferacaceae archaeon]
MPGTKRIVIAGGGDVGLETARELNDRGHDVVVIERDEARAEAVADERVAVVIQGDAAQPSVLEQAEPERADAVAALTDEPGRNLAVCMEAKRLAPEVRTLARIGAASETEYEEIVDATILPRGLSAATAADILSGDEVRTIAGDHHDLRILEIEVAEGAPVAGRPLDEVSLPRGSLVISDRARSRIAGADTVLEAGERYVVGVEPAVVDEVVNLFRG